MRRLKTIGKVLAGAVGLLTLAVLGVAFVPAAAYEPEPRDVRDESSYRLDERVGWYRLEDGSCRLLTWGAENGLVMYGFGSERETLHRTPFTPDSARALVASGSTGVKRLEFRDREEGAVNEARSAHVAFVVTVSGSAATPSEQLAYEVRREIVSSGAPELVGRMLAPLFARRAKMPRKLWWELNGRFDPIGSWRELDVPCLMIFGDADQNVDVARTLERLRVAGVLDRASFRTKVLPGLSHGLIRPDTGWLEGEYLESLARFIRQEPEP